jgi:hypothetical protein
MTSSNGHLFAAGVHSFLASASPQYSQSIGAAGGLSLIRQRFKSSSVGSIHSSLPV